jgi:hypothetical protein
MLLFRSHIIPQPGCCCSCPHMHLSYPQLQLLSAKQLYPPCCCLIVNHFNP